MRRAVERSIIECIEEYEEVKNSPSNLGNIYYLQELAREVRKEIKDALKKDVNFGVIRYTNFHGDRQECRNVDRLLATIVKFGFKEKEEKIQEQKDVSEQKKYAATISRHNLQSEVIPTLFMTPMKNNLAVYIRCIWSKFRLVGSNDPASMFNLIYTVKKTAGPLSTQIGQYRKFTDILKHISIYYLQAIKASKHCSTSEAWSPPQP